MYLKLDNIERIEHKNLTDIILGHDKYVHFSGRALENEGKRIHEQLSKLKIGEIIEVEFDTNHYHPHEGIYEIVKLDIPHPDTNKAPVIYRFSGILKPVY